MEFRSLARLVILASFAVNLVSSISDGAVLRHLCLLQATTERELTEELNKNGLLAGDGFLVGRVVDALRGELDPTMSQGGLLAVEWRGRTALILEENRAYPWVNRILRNQEESSMSHLAIPQTCLEEISTKTSRDQVQVMERLGETRMARNSRRDALKKPFEFWRLQPSY